MSDKIIPTIKPSAQARLFLYQLIKGKLTDAEHRLLQADPGLWLRVLELLEREVDSGTSIKSDQTKLGTVFSLIAKATVESLQKQIQHVTGKSLWIGRHPSDLLDAFVTEHSQLIKSVQREQLEKIKLAISRGIREGHLHKDIAKDIRQMTDISKRRAQLIARNAPLQYSGALTKHHQMSAGIKRYRWQTSQDERVRKSHRNKNGKIYKWDASGPCPRSEVNCRCDAVPVLDF